MENILTQGSRFHSTKTAFIEKERNSKHPVHMQHILRMFIFVAQQVTTNIIACVALQLFHWGFCETVGLGFHFSLEGSHKVSLDCDGDLMFRSALVANYTNVKHHYILFNIGCELY